MRSALPRRASLHFVRRAGGPGTIRGGPWALPLVVLALVLLLLMLLLLLQHVQMLLPQVHVHSALW